MFGPFRRTEEDGIDKQIKRILDDMDMFGPGSEEYDILLPQLKKLMKLKDTKKSKSIDPNTVVLVVGNLVGILIIVMYEEKHVITSKAFSVFVKSRN